MNKSEVDAISELIPVIMRHTPEDPHEISQGGLKLLCTRIVELEDGVHREEHKVGCLMDEAERLSNVAKNT